MKKLMLFIVLLIPATLFAQEYKVARSTGKLELNIGRVEVEGYAGNEIIFSGRDGSREKDDRASGLKAINGSGLDDNTGLGIHVEEKDGVIKVSQLKKMHAPNIKIMVPKGMAVSYRFESQYAGDVSIRNMEGEIEISANYNSVELANITGPVTAKSIYGHIEATFQANVKGPVSIISVYGYVDVALPVATKANIRMKTSYGELFAAPDFKIETQNTEDENKVEGKLNGGGLTIDLTCNYGKIYLRKK